MNEIMACFILLMGLAASAETTLASEVGITGRVVITKVMTKRRVALPSYDLRGAAVNPESPGKTPPANPTVDELSRVVIYLEGPGLKPGVPAQSSLIQKGRRFEPDITIIPVGSTVSFPNEDPIFHNVFSLSKVKQFDLGYYPAGESRTVKFDRPGVVQVYCHIHPDMSAAIVVLASGIWTRPGSDGRFSLSGFPRGAYDLVAWHRFAGFFRRHITVGDGVLSTEDFVIPVKDTDAAAGSKAGSAP